MKDLKNLPKGTKVVDKFSKGQTFGRTAIILDQDEDGDYWCFYLDTAYGYNTTEEEEEFLESIGVDDFGTCNWCFPEWMEVVED